MNTQARTEPVIEFKDVHLGFDEGEVLRGICFEVAPRETKVLLGETGSGKTVTLKLAAGLRARSNDGASIEPLSRDLLRAEHLREHLRPVRSVVHEKEQVVAVAVVGR